MLKIDHLTKYYGTFKSLNNLSLNLVKGEILGFIGPNGAGKSTTIKSILQLLHYQGEISLFNIINAKDNIDIKKRIGYLSSETSLYQEYTVKKHLDFHASFYQNINWNYVSRLVELLQLDLNKKISSLSLGNKKKVGIILALMHNPDLIIMDEASSGLDPLIQKHLYDILIEEKNKGKTILFSSHNLREVMLLADRIAIIKNGQILKVAETSSFIETDYVQVSFVREDDYPYTEFNPTINNNNVEFVYTKDSLSLITFLSQRKLSNLKIEPLPIERIFTSYYE